jgi:uncharacterized protein (DUF1810 family)
MPDLTRAKNLDRFIDAQANIYDSALAELRRGKKEGHWMWFIFPQVRGLGSSAKSNFFGIQNRAEAREYLDDPVLGKRLLECTNTLLSVNGVTAEEIFGHPDVLKLKSSMTLFENVSSNGPFAKVLEKYYQGQRDTKTLGLLQNDITNK